MYLAMNTTDSWIFQVNNWILQNHYQQEYDEYKQYFNKHCKLFTKWKCQIYDSYVNLVLTGYFRLNVLVLLEPYHYP